MKAPQKISVGSSAGPVTELDALKQVQAETAVELDTLYPRPRV
jgi:hypothetical protein